MNKLRDHGGGLDAAIAHYGGTRADWLDLSTGINPEPYPIPPIPDHAWNSLPDQAAMQQLETAARHFWNVPGSASIIAAPGASALIARLPHLLGQPAQVSIPQPTYNEWQAAFENAGWTITDNATVRVHVHPNNPDGRLHPAPNSDHITIIDESFCDTIPDQSHIAHAGPRTIIIKSFGKFWGLAGIRLGFMIGDATLIAQMAEALGPWPVAGPTLTIGATALADDQWATQTRYRRNTDVEKLDKLMQMPSQGTALFRLYQVDDAAKWQDKFAQSHIWTRTFPYSKTMLRLGLPAPDRWDQLRSAL